MKFECPSCGKKYSLPDEKVPSGKDFKVKCKKCGEVIVLRGGVGDEMAPPADAGAPFDAPPDENSGPDEQPTRVFDYSRMGSDMPAEDQGPASFVSAQAGAFHAAVPAEPAQEPPAPFTGGGDDIEWYIAVDGEQMGPYDSVQIREMLAAGQISDETLLWRDGFDNWLALREVPDFGAAQPAVAARAPAPGPSANSPFAIGGGGRGQDIFASAGSEGPSESPFAAPRTGGAGGAVSSSLGAEPQSPRVDAGQLTGARHENSVLFSLASLQALATSSRDPAPHIGAPGGLGSATSSGGSGLIDIRALTAATGSGASSSKASEDILSMGGSGLGSPMGVPSLLQPVKKEPSKLPYILGGVGGLVVIGALVVVLVVLLKGKDQPESTFDEDAMRQKILAELMAQGIGKAEAEKMAAEQAADKSSTSADPGTESGSGADGTQTDPGSEEDKKGGGPRKPGKKKPGEPGTDPGSESTGPAPTKTESGSKSVPGSIEDDLLKALSGGGTKPKKVETPEPTKKDPPTPPPSSDLPDKPSKQDVINALQGVTPGVKACGKGETGVATVSINIAGATGKVTSASVVSGPFKDTPAASCIVSAVKKASFPKFAQKKFSVSYPFVVK